MNKPEKKIVSLSSVKPVKVRFTNASPHSITLHWINYEGKEVLYKILKTKQFVDVNTFENHAWTFRNAITDEKYVVKNNSVFVAKSFKPVVINNVQVGRINYNVTEPLRRLRDMVLLYLCTRLNSQQVHQLNMPASLIDELDDLISLYNIC